MKGTCLSSMAASSSSAVLLHATSFPSSSFRTRLSQIQPFALSLSLSFRAKSSGPIRRLHHHSGGGNGREKKRVGSVTNNNVAAPAKDMDERVQQIHSIAEFEEALVAAKNKLVVVEYAAKHSPQSKKIYPFMVGLSKTCADVDFLLVMGDESDELKALCRREKVELVPHFTFYKNGEKIHEEEGIGPDQLMGDVLYYGDNDSPVIQLHSRADVEGLIQKHKADGKLIVLDVGLKHCGPCVKVYPTVVRLSKQMTDTVVFARMNGDENDSCIEFLKEMAVVQVPTFVFVRDGTVLGRYVGSGKGELIGEILRYQGVRVT